MQAVPSLDRDIIERCTVSFFRKGWPTLPDIRLVEVDGRRWVVKDWRRRSWVRRLLQGRFMLRREHRFLMRLDGVPGVPRSGGFPDADSLAIEWLDGRPVSGVYPQDYPRGYFDRLDALVRAVHARGVAHGDLDQDDNVLMCADGSPALIDFGNALAATWFPLVRVWHDLLVRHDLQCVARLRGRFELDPVHPDPQPPPELYAWQKRVLVFFRKMERNEPERQHGVGENPAAPPAG